MALRRLILANGSFPFPPSPEEVTRSLHQSYKKIYEIFMTGDTLSLCSGGGSAADCKMPLPWREPAVGHAK
jgi:hypothetical protein